MGKETTLLFIQHSDGCLVPVRQGEIEYVEVLDHALIVGGLWNHHNALLDVPAQHDLGGGFPALRANGGKQCVRKVQIKLTRWCALHRLFDGYKKQNP